MSIKFTYHAFTMGVGGEGHTNMENRVWISKTHFPHMLPDSQMAFPEKNIAVVRNPIDIFPSMAILMNTLSHSMVPDQKLHEDFPEQWNSFLTQHYPVLVRTHENMINEFGKAVPTYIMRYEDLRTDPEPVLREAFKFLLDVESIDGTIVEERIKRYS